MDVLFKEVNYMFQTGFGVKHSNELFTEDEVDGYQGLNLNGHLENF